MLSVLIPVFHWDPSPLVRDLQQQLDQSGLAYEIIVSDDTPSAGKPGYQTHLECRPEITCIFRETSLGRSANRNRLAGMARYPYLLFIDGDAGMANPDFISKYVGHLDPGKVLAGGTLYPDQMPEDSKMHLRWKFGKAREQKPASIRRKNPWRSFSTFNFVVPAEVFKKISFNEAISGYGHEDTFFGFQLRNEGIPIVHLDNGLLHMGIEPSDQFLVKVRESIHNLYDLQKAGTLPPDLIQDIHLLKKYRSVRLSGTKGLIRILFKVFHKTIEKRLNQPNPPLVLLDLFKLGLICRIA
jgi:GT2 family glycosyltransferase